MQLACAVLMPGRCGRCSGLVVAVVPYLLAWVVCPGDAVSWPMQVTTFKQRSFAHVDMYDLVVTVRADPRTVGLSAGACVVLLAIVMRVALQQPEGRSHPEDVCGRPCGKSADASDWGAGALAGPGAGAGIGRSAGVAVLARRWAPVAGVDGAGAGRCLGKPGDGEPHSGFQSAFAAASHAVS